MAENEIISTDEAILDSIGEGDESPTDEGNESTDSTTPQEFEEEASPAGSEQGVDGSNVEQQQQSVGSPQDLRDRDGQVVARGGAERRLYENLQREKNRADTNDRQVKELTGQLNAINDAGTVGTQYNLTPEEVTTGAQVISAYKQDPVGTLKYMLTQAQAAGHNVDELLGGGGIDAGAIQQMIASQLQPLLSEYEQRADTQAAHDQALQIYNDFSSKYPDAATHEASLARLLQEDPNLTPDAAYFKLRSYYAERGLDWTKNLVTLQNERRAAPSGNTQQQLPEGGVPATNVTDAPQVADVNMSFDDIIRESMKDAGIN